MLGNAETEVSMNFKMQLVSWKSVPKPWAATENPPPPACKNYIMHNSQTKWWVEETTKKHAL
mgnify:FL=1